VGGKSSTRAWLTVASFIWAIASAPAPAGETATRRRELALGFLPSQAPAPPQDDAPKPLAPPPRSGDADWVQLTSGEWLKGEITELQDDKLIFDSDEFDEQQIDWDDVAAIYSKRKSQLGFVGQEVVEGIFEIEGDTVRIVREGGETQERPRAELRSIIPGERRELNFWSGKLSFGATLRSGNVDQTDVSGLARFQRRTVFTRLLLEYNGAYGEVEGTKTVNNHRGTASFDYYFTERLFWRIIGFAALSDEFQNIDYRLTPSSAIGYDIIDTPEITWEALAGAGWQYTRFLDPPPGEPESTDFASLVVGSRFQWEATARTDVGVDFDGTVPFEEADAFNSRLVLWSEIEVWGDLDLDIRFTWDRQNDPTPNADGSVPKKDDFRLFLGVSWSF